MKNDLHQAKQNAQSGVAALERGLTILEAFKDSGDGLSLSELAGRTGLYKSTILRLCASFERFGYLQRFDDGTFRLGPAPFQLGRAYQQSFKLATATMPVLRALVAETGESASLYVRAGAYDVCLHRVESPHHVRDAGTAEGDRFPIDDSACSRVLSAFTDGAGRRHDPVRRQMVVPSRNSARVPGAAAVACPVFGVGQRLVGALLLSGPQSRFSAPAVANMKAAILKGASNLTRVLGGNAAVFERVAAASARQ